jgi:hypothetical protein
MNRITVILLIACLALAGPSFGQAVPPGGWTASETIGNAAEGNAVSPSPGVYELTGNGDDIWNAADAFHFLYKELTGDGSATCRVTSNGTGSNTWAKSGVMIRQDNTPGSQHAMMICTGGDGGGGSFQHRPTPGAASLNTDTPITLPYWVKIERVGDDFTGSKSADGVSWETVGTVTVAMTDPVLIGLPVTSHAAGELRTFTIDNVSFEGAVTGETPPGAAVNPSPPNEAVDVIPDVTLSWFPGMFASQHDVYFGTDFDEVNDATVDSPLYMGRQSETRYTPAGLELGQMYYWRIDEPNDTPDKYVWKGSVWSFELEPVSFAVPIGAVSATASSTTAGQDPNNLVNGSGLDPNDEHSNLQEFMWLGEATDLTPSVVFEFAQQEKLDKARIWNHNTQTESIVGFGMKETRIEASLDGEAWTEVGTVELAQATGMATYTGEEVDLGGAVARYIRITGLSNYSILGLPQKGLSEVRFYAVPMRARLEIPADGSTGIDPLVELTWRAGREAAQHEVLVGTDPNNLSPVATVDEPSYTAVVDMDSTVYWQVNEINDAMDPPTWEGNIWTMDTAEYVTVDDMESYQSEEGSFVWETWVDGFGDDNNGALLGHGGDNMETDSVYDGRQSLPYYYGQGGAGTSEAVRDIERNWGEHGIVSLSLMFQGDPSNTPGQMYIKVNDAKIATYPTSSDLTIPQWQAWTIDLPAAALGNVKNLAIGIDGGTGLVLIDAIRLYAKASETIAPEAASDADLFAYYPFEGNYNDASGNSLNGTPVDNPSLLNDPVRGQVLNLDGFAACVDLGASDAFNPQGSFSISVWANISEFINDWGHALIGKRGEDNLGWQLRRHSSTPNLTFTLRGTTGVDDPQGTVSMESFYGEWIHIAAVYDYEVGQRTVYVNGLVDVSIADTNPVAATDHKVYIGARATAANNGPEAFYSGMLDELKLYKRALSQAEALDLAGRTEPIFKAF